MAAYAELLCASHFSFLRGASSAEELLAQAAVSGHYAVAITDRNSLAGMVRAREAAKVTGVRLFVGCRLILVALEDETAIANLVIWPSLYEQQRRLILTASIMGVEERIQREGEVVHVVVRKLHDLSGELAGLSERDTALPLPHGRGDEFHHGSTPDARDRSPPVKTRDTYIPDLHIDTLKVKAREFR